MGVESDDRPRDGVYDVTCDLSLSGPAEELLRRHRDRFRRDRRAAALFVPLPGRTAAVTADAYAELVDAGLMHPVHPAGVGSPGTFCLAARAVPEA
jgi:hypothetical protein